MAAETGYRACDTPKLLELIRMDPLCAPYRDLAQISKFEHGGKHLLIMLLPFANVEVTHDIAVHRVEVNAKLTGTMKPYRFNIEIPAIHWEKLKRLTPAGKEID